MRIAILGGTGFIGSYITKILISDGNEVVLLHRTKTDFKRIEELITEIHTFNIETGSLVDFFKESKIELVIHVATYHKKQLDEDIIQPYLETNVWLPTRVFEIAKEHGCRYFINTGSFFEKSFGKGMYMGKYVLSKKQFRDWGEYFIADGDACFITLQLEHVFGLDDNDGKFVPYILNSIEDGTDKIPLGSGTHKRDWISVEDVAQAYSCVIKNINSIYINNKNSSVVFEVGTGNSRDIRTMVGLICYARNSQIGLAWGEYVPKLKEIDNSVADNGSLLNMGWRPKVVTDDEIINYFRR